MAFYYTNQAQLDNPYLDYLTRARQQQQQQAQQQTVSPQSMMKMFNQGQGSQGGSSGMSLDGLGSMFGGGGGTAMPSSQVPSLAAGAPEAASMGTGTFGGGSAGGAGGAGGSAMAAMGPYAMIAGMLLTNNVLHNKDIAQWSDHFKGTAGAETGEHFLDQWGVDDDSFARDIAGVMGWGKGGGVFNPSYLSSKLFGD